VGIAAIVPARDEAARIGETVCALVDIADISETIVVDDASTDGTADRARAAGALVIRLPTRRGKGGALRAGLERTTAEILIFIDGDLGATAEVARVLLVPVLAGEADMTIAAPSPGQPSGFGLVEGLSRAGIRALTGRRFARPLSGQRALRRTVVARASIAPRFGVETALTIDAVRAGFRVVEIPVEFEHSRTERNAAGFGHRARQGSDVALALLSRLRPRSARA
jgi:glycosyltransferase involved in cell wall biosynthesis